jgi:hypothetical protein
VIRLTTSVSRKKFHIPQRASQGRRSTEGDRVFLLLLSNVNQTWIFSTDFRKKKRQISNFMKIRPVEAVQYARMDMPNLRGAYRNYANAPKNLTYLHCYQSWCLSYDAMVGTRYPVRHTHSPPLYQKPQHNFIITPVTFYRYFKAVSIRILHCLTGC